MYVDALHLQQPVQYVICQRGVWQVSLSNMKNRMYCYFYPETINYTCALQQNGAQNVNKKKTQSDFHADSLATNFSLMSFVNSCKSVTLSSFKSTARRRS